MVDGGAKWESPVHQHNRRHISVDAGSRIEPLTVDFCFPFFAGAGASFSTSESSVATSFCLGAAFDFRDAAPFEPEGPICTFAWKKGHGFPERSSRFRCSSLREVSVNTEK